MTQPAPPIRRPFAEVLPSYWLSAAVLAVCVFVFQCFPARSCTALALIPGSNPPPPGSRIQSGAQMVASAEPPPPFQHPLLSSASSPSMPPQERRLGVPGRNIVGEGGDHRGMLGRCAARRTELETFRNFFFPHRQASGRPGEILGRAVA